MKEVRDFEKVIAGKGADAVILSFDYIFELNADETEYKIYLDYESLTACMNDQLQEIEKAGLTPFLYVTKCLDEFNKLENLPLFDHM